MSKYHNDCHAVLKTTEVFPIEIDLSHSTLTYEHDSNQYHDNEEEEEEEEQENTQAATASGDLISTD